MGSLYGFEVKSELPLARLNAATGTRGELAIGLATGKLAPPPGREPVSTLEDRGQRWYSSYELDDGACLLEMPPTGSFLVEPDPGRITVSHGDVDQELLEHRIASSAVCVLLALRGDLVLHASAVEAGDGVVVFCGPTRRGKSSLVRALGRAGHRVLSEDGIAVELGTGRPLAFPGARGVRMRREDGEGRRTDLLPDPGPGEPPPGPVAALVLLGERGSELEIEPLRRSRGLALLTPNLVHSGGRDSIGAAFGRLAALIGSTPALRVSMPDDLGTLPAAAQRALDAAASAG